MIQRAMGGGLLTDFKVGVDSRGVLDIYDLLFADDTIVFCDG